MLKLIKNKDILLFYKKHKWDYVKNYSKRSISGFYSWYTLLVEALQKFGFNVFENRYDLAMENPNYPVGLVGTPIILSNWQLPNPAVLGPSMYDHPSINPTLMDDNRFKYYLLTCGWLRDIFIKTYDPKKCVLWFAGISTDKWVDTSMEQKTVDVLIYDKIRWEREKTVPLLINPVINYLKDKGLTYQVLKYGNITHRQYRNILKKSRAMIFMCEHETQGIAYQEALASNIPIIAWNHGWWTDPVWQAYSDVPLKATSVPMFSPECGEIFKNIVDFPQTFDIFWKKIKSYSPRKFIENELSLKKSAELYSNYYFNCSD